MTSRIVYTAIFGGYERLRPQPTAAASESTFYCFTDEPELVSEHWTIVPVEPLFRHDPVRSARALKTTGHPLLDDAEETLWVDNRVELTADPGEILDEWLADTDAAFVEHSFRDTLLDEFTAVADGGLDDTTRVWEHLLHLSESHPDLLDTRPLWTGMVARRRTAVVEDFGRLWQNLINRYSRRDQLSVQQAIATSGLAVRVLDLDNRTSPWHRWPQVDKALRRRPAYHDRWQNAIRPPSVTAADLRDRNLRLERRVQELEDEQLAAATRDAEALEQLATAQGRIESLSAQLADERSAAADTSARVVELEDEVGVRRRANDRLREEVRTARRDLDGIISSGSYRLASRIAHLRGTKRS